MRSEKLVSDRAVSTYHLEGEKIRLSWDTHGLPVGQKVAEKNETSWVTCLRFADQTAFQRAFKKWARTSCGKYRKKKQQA